MKVKIVEPSSEVWWERTYETTLKINEEEFTIRVSENPNGITTLVLINDQWRDLDHMELTPNLKNLQELLEELSVSEFNEKDSEFDFDIIDV